MPVVAVAIATFAVDTAIVVFLSGVAFYALWGDRYSPESKLPLVWIFIFLLMWDLSSYPFLILMDATVEVHNDTIAGLMDLQGPVALQKLVFDFGWFDLLDYTLRSLIANMVGRWFLSRKTAGPGSSAACNASNG